MVHQVAHKSTNAGKTNYYLLLNCHYNLSQKNAHLKHQSEPVAGGRGASMQSSTTGGVGTCGVGELLQPFIKL